MIRASLALPLSALLLALSGAACGPAPKATTSTLAGTVVDGRTNQPVANALVAVYDGTVSQSITLTRVGDPNFSYGIATDSKGQFQVTVPASNYSVRVFAKGYHCGDAPGSGKTQVALLPYNDGDVPPTITDASFTPPRVVPGDASQFVANLAAKSDDDWLSHKVFLFEPLTRAVKQLDAPGDMTAKGWPDGTWQTQINAPNNTGGLIYTLVVASQQCLVAFGTAQLVIAR